MSKCQMFECDEEANGGYPCCGANHGYISNGDKGQLEKAINGVIEWNDKFYGISKWTVEKYLYYLTMIRG